MTSHHGHFYARIVLPGASTDQLTVSCLRVVRDVVNWSQVQGRTENTTDRAWAVIGFDVKMHPRRNPGNGRSQYHSSVNGRLHYDRRSRGYPEKRR